MTIRENAYARRERTMVVLVDDYAAVRRQLAEVLRLHGFDVVGAAATFQEGRAVVERLRPDVAVIDNQMPDGLGVDLCVELAQICPDTIIIICAASITSEQVRFATTHGAAAVVPKDARARHLIDSIDQLTAPAAPTHHTGKSPLPEHVGAPSRPSTSHHLHPRPRPTPRPTPRPRPTRTCPQGPAR